MNILKKLFLFGIAASLMLAACSHEPTTKTQESPTPPAETAPPQLQTGDLIFVGLPMSYSIDSTATNLPANASTCAGDSLNLIHVAIAEVQGDSAWIIDATLKHNIDRYPLDTFLKDFTLADGSSPYFIIKRLKDNSLAEKHIENAKQFIGCQYDVEFLPDNDNLFCSELVRNSYLKPDGTPLFQEYPMDFQKVDGTFPIYWQQLFQWIQQPIPQGRRGTTPAQMEKESILQTIYCGNEIPRH